MQPAYIRHVELILATATTDVLSVVIAGIALILSMFNAFRARALRRTRIELKVTGLRESWGDSELTVLAVNRSQRAIEVKQVYAEPAIDTDWQDAEWRAPLVVLKPTQGVGWSRTEVDVEGGKLKIEPEAGVEYTGRIREKAVLRIEHDGRSMARVVLETTGGALFTHELDIATRARRRHAPDEDAET
jgi:hypothetical protein